ncbi:MAG TPA: sulfatase-like hydrolase/transferase [Polyangiaceae bacterium]
MSRAGAFVRSLGHPPLLGAVYVLVLAAWAAQSPTVDDRAGGAQARQIEAVVTGRFGGEIGRVGVAILAAAIVVGALLGWAAWGLVLARDAASGGAPSRSVLRETLLVLGVAAALHGLLELWGMAHDPPLYADAWYARGGVRRTVQVLATDVLGPGGVALLGCAGILLFLAGPPSRWRLWPARLARFGRRLADVGAAPGSLLSLAVAALATCAALLALGLVVFTIPTAHAAPAPADERPNVLVLAADSLRNDRLDPRTAPHLAAFAERGTRFDRAYVSLPRTFPSWVTILTGRHPHHHGIRSMFPRWEERAHDFDALPGRLAHAGYATGVASDYAGDVFSRIDLGFGRVDVPEFDFRQLVRQRALERETPLMPLLHSRAGRAGFPVMREMNDAADPAMLARDAIRTMRALEGRGPFLLVVFFSTAHFPYAAPAPYYRRFTDPAYRGRYKYDKPVGLGQDAPADARDQAQVRALYDGAVSAIDDAAQSILDATRSDGIEKKTIVVVTADHGETLYDHGHGAGHGDHLFGDEGTHVPLVIVDPRSTTGDGSAAPHRVSSIVRDVDLAPTLYELTGVAPPRDLDGQSLAPALAGAAIAQEHAYAETGLWFTEEIPGLPDDLRLPYPGIARLTEVDTQHGDDLVLQKAMRPLTIVAKHRMVRDERWKLLYVPARTGVRWLLYDTQADPGETVDVAAAHPDVLARMQGELWAWMRLDVDMTERGGYLVPRDARVKGSGEGDVGLVRLEGGGESAPPPAAAAP